MENISFYMEGEIFYAQLGDNISNLEIVDILVILGFSTANNKKFFIDLKPVGPVEKNKLLLRLNSYLNNQQYVCVWDLKSKEILDFAEKIKEKSSVLREKAKELLKNELKDESDLYSKDFKRTLKDFQKESVFHLINLPFAANFSVPGSGKTTLVYAAYSKLKEE